MSEKLEKTQEPVSNIHTYARFRGPNYPSHTSTYQKTFDCQKSREKVNRVDIGTSSTLLKQIGHGDRKVRGTSHKTFTLRRLFNSLFYCTMCESR